MAHTWLKLFRVVPVKCGVLDGVVGHPEQGPTGDGQLATAQDKVVRVADPDLPNPHWWVHPQHLLCTQQAVQ
jgi:hypothetical protein